METNQTKAIEVGYIMIGCVIMVVAGIISKYIHSISFKLVIYEIVQFAVLYDVIQH